MADNSIGELFRRGDYYIVKRIREIVGDQKATSIQGGEQFSVQLLDSSDSKEKLFDPSYDGGLEAMLAAADGDIIIYPPGGSYIYPVNLYANADDPGPAVAIVGHSRQNTKGGTDTGTLTDGGSIEGLSWYRTINSAAYSAGIETFDSGGTSHIINCNITFNNTGSGGCYGIQAADHTLNVWNSVISADAATSANGFAAHADAGGVINMYNCLLRATATAITKLTSTGIINLYGCTTEVIP